ILSSQLPGFFSPTGGWYNFSVRSANWFKSVLSGYMISCFVFSVVDGLNAALLPASLFSPDPGLVGRLVSGSTEGAWVAKAVGAIAPCLSAPWWEEVGPSAAMPPPVTSLRRHAAPRHVPPPPCRPPSRPSAAMPPPVTTLVP
ncbi:hypothetical protein TrRE_jg13615, partial [Triparma retinervis]